MITQDKLGLKGVGNGKPMLVRIMVPSGLWRQICCRESKSLTLSGLSSKDSVYYAESLDKPCEGDVVSLRSEVLEFFH